LVRLFNSTKYVLDTLKRQRQQRPIRGTANPAPQLPACARDRLRVQREMIHRDLDMLRQQKTAKKVDCETREKERRAICGP
jgi:hypothetical protein